jgi:hypothetical protein
VRGLQKVLIEETRFIGRKCEYIRIPSRVVSSNLTPRTIS